MMVIPQSSRLLYIICLRLWCGLILVGRDLLDVLVIFVLEYRKSFCHFVSHGVKRFLNGGVLDFRFGLCGKCLCSIYVKCIGPLYLFLHAWMYAVFWNEYIVRFMYDQSSFVYISRKCKAEEGKMVNCETNTLFYRFFIALGLDLFISL